MPFQSYYLSPAGDLRRDLAEEEIRAAVESEEGILWVDIQDTTVDDGRFLARTFDFHSLAIDICLDPTIHAPRAADFERYLFLVFRGIDYTVESDILETTELDMFLGPHFLVTNHNTFLHSIDTVIKLVEENGRLMSRGAAFLAHTIVDALVENIIPTIDRLGERADAIEQEILAGADESSLQAMMAHKRSLLRLRRALSPEMDILSRLSRKRKRLSANCKKISSGTPGPLQLPRQSRPKSGR